MAPSNTLVDRLPDVRGSYEEQASLAAHTWFRVGGPADVLFKPADIDDLAHFKAKCPKDIPCYVIGVGSNLMVRDGGMDGVVIRLMGKAFNHISIDGQKVTAGAAVLDRQLALHAARAGIEGLEFFYGVPGTVGGALRMNAGAHGGETKDTLIAATVVTDKGEIKTLSPQEIGHSYRNCAVPKDWIFVEAVFEGAEQDPKILRERLDHIQETRESTQPIKSRTGGSTFKNPEGHSSWKLIDEAGGRGLRVGGAQVSEMHCNFLINTGDATATDLESLGETVRQRVNDNSGIMLEWEIKRIGRN